MLTWAIKGEDNTSRVIFGIKYAEKTQFTTTNERISKLDKIMVNHQRNDENDKIDER